MRNDLDLLNGKHSSFYCKGNNQIEQIEQICEIKFEDDFVNTCRSINESYLSHKESFDINLDILSQFFYQNHNILQDNLISVEAFISKFEEFGFGNMLMDILSFNPSEVFTGLISTLDCEFRCIFSCIYFISVISWYEKPSFFSFLEKYPFFTYVYQVFLNPAFFFTQDQAILTNTCLINTALYPNGNEEALMSFLNDYTQFSIRCAELNIPSNQRLLLLLKVFKATNPYDWPVRIEPFITSIKGNVNPDTAFNACRLYSLLLINPQYYQDILNEAPYIIELAFENRDSTGNTTSAALQFICGLLEKCEPDEKLSIIRLINIAYFHDCIESDNASLSVPAIDIIRFSCPECLNEILGMIQHSLSSLLALLISQANNSPINIKLATISLIKELVGGSHISCRTILDSDIEEFLIPLLEFGSGDISEKAIHLILILLEQSRKWPMAQRDFVNRLCDFNFQNCIDSSLESANEEQFMMISRMKELIDHILN